MEPNIQKIDAETISIAQPVTYKIRELKAQLDTLQTQKQMLKGTYDAEIAGIQPKIDELKALILQAKTVGVE